MEFGVPPSLVRVSSATATKCNDDADDHSSVALKEFSFVARGGGGEGVPYPILLAFANEFRAMNALNKLKSPYLV